MSLSEEKNRRDFMPVYEQNPTHPEAFFLVPQSSAHTPLHVSLGFLFPSLCFTSELDYHLAYNSSHAQLPGFQSRSELC